MTELLDVRHMVLLHLPLEDAPHVLNRVQVWRHTWTLHHLQLQKQGSSHLSGVFGVVVMLENSFWRESIIFCFRMSQYMLESMFPSMNRSSPVPAALMQPQTMMLPPPCLTVGKASCSWYSSPGRRHTCWTPSESNKFKSSQVKSALLSILPHVKHIHTENWNCVTLRPLVHTVNIKHWQ